jgi:hypothetical protein
MGPLDKHGRLSWKSYQCRESSEKPRHVWETRQRDIVRVAYFPRGYSNGLQSVGVKGVIHELIHGGLLRPHRLP